MIGFFDSGKGGLNVLADAIDRGECGDIVYLSDPENAPFGEKSLSEVRSIVERITTKLVDLGCEKIVCACNTASLAVDGIYSPKTFFPMIFDFDFKEKTLFAGTSLAVDILSSKIRNDNLRFVKLERLATFIDNAAPENIIEEYLKSKLEGYPSIDNLILGCTHYYYALNSIEKHCNAKKITRTVNAYLNTIEPKEGVVRIYFEPEKLYEYSRILLSRVEIKKSDRLEIEPIEKITKRI